MHIKGIRSIYKHIIAQFRIGQQIALILKKKKTTEPLWAAQLPLLICFFINSLQLFFRRFRIFTYGGFTVIHPSHPYSILADDFSCLWFYKILMIRLAIRIDFKGLVDTFAANLVVFARIENNAVEKHNRIYAVKRPCLPFIDLGQNFVCNMGNKPPVKFQNHRFHAA